MTAAGRTKQIWKCDSCGKESEWSSTWSSKMILHRRGLWDETVTVCSDACATAFDKRRRIRNVR